MKELTDDEINVAICEWLGLTVIDIPFVPTLVKPDETYVFTRAAAQQWRLAYPTGGSIRWLPNHLTGSEALGHIHEAEKRLTANQWPEYGDELRKSAHGSSWPVWHATARQRAIALLHIVTPELFQP